MNSQRQLGLIVGVSDYQTKPLPAVSNDVRAMKALLTSQTGALAGASVKVLLDAGASADVVLKQMRETCENVTSQDVLFLYFSGHGAKLNDRYYFIPHSGPMIPLEDIRVLFEKAKCRGAFLFLDICHGGGIVGRQAESRSNSAEVQEAVSRALVLSSGSGQVIMAACASHEEAFESNGHGHFTKALVEGLKGAATNSRGDVTANSLHDYICHVVKGQTPVYHASLSGSVALVHHDPSTESNTARPPTTPPIVKIRDSGDLLLFDDFFVAGAQVYEKDNGDWEVTVNSNDPHTDARLGEYSSTGGRGYAKTQSVRVAYQNISALMNVKQVERRSLGSSTNWTLVLSPQKDRQNQPTFHTVTINNRTFHELEIRELKTKAIIFGRENLDVGNNAGRILGACQQATRKDLIPPIGTQELKQFRLRLVSELLHHLVVDHITTLSLESKSDGVIEVVIEGNVSSRYNNQSPQQVRVKGTINIG